MDYNQKLTVRMDHNTKFMDHNPTPMDHGPTPTDHCQAHGSLPNTYGSPPTAHGSLPKTQWVTPTPPNFIDHYRSPWISIETHEAHVSITAVLCNLCISKPGWCTGWATGWCPSQNAYCDERRLNHLV